MEKGWHGAGCAMAREKRNSLNSHRVDQPITKDFRVGIQIVTAPWSKNQRNGEAPTVEQIGECPEFFDGVTMALGPDGALAYYDKRIRQKNAGSSAPRLDLRRQFNRTEAGHRNSNQ
jgi:hypothetical protein